MKKYTFIFLSAFLFPFVSLVLADEKSIKENSNIKNKCCSPCCEKVPKICGYNMPVNLNLRCNWKLFLTGSYLYWQAKEDGLELGTITYPDIEQSQPVTRTEVNNLKFDFSSGFKILGGISFDRDNWEIFMDYTRYNVKDNTFTAVGVYSGYRILSNWFATAQLFNQIFGVRGSWKLNLDLLDAEVSRLYFVGKKLLFKTHFGLMGGWLDQKYDLIGSLTRNVNLSQKVYSTTNFKSDSWLIGPKIGLNTSWVICNYLKMFGNVGTSLCYQKIKTFGIESVPAISVRNPTLNLAATKTTFQSEVGFITPILDISLGLNSGFCFCKKRYHLEFETGYDFEYFWRQNMINYTENKPSSSANTPIYNLMIQGLRISAKMDF